MSGLKVNMDPPQKQGGAYKDLPAKPQSGSSHTQPDRNGDSCVFCGSSDSTKSCGRCKSAYYCSQEWQRKHWKVHKTSCKEVKSANEPTEDGVTSDTTVHNRRGVPAMTTHEDIGA